MNLTSKNARKELEQQHNIYWTVVSQGVSIGYRKGARGSAWFVRRHVDGKRYVVRKLGTADDSQKSNGTTILSWDEALAKALDYKDIVPEIKKPEHPAMLTVGKCCDDYMKWFKAHRKSVDATRTTIDAHIRPKFGNLPLSRLSTGRIESWLTEMSVTPPTTTLGNVKPPYSVRTDTGKRTKGKGRIVYAFKPVPFESWTDDMKRKRKASANRVLTVLKALLNHQWRTSEVNIDPNPWRKVKPFEGVNAPRVKYLKAEQARQLIAGASDDFRPLVRAALYTGCRYGELANLRAHDLHGSELHISGGKTGERTIPLSPDGAKFFARLSAEKRTDDYLITHTDGTPWGRSHQVRPMQEACDTAGLDRINFHALRHSYAVMLLRPKKVGKKVQQGVSIRHVAELLGDTVVTTARYYGHVVQEDLQSEVNRMMPSF